jgi:hypothetical protein
MLKGDSPEVITKTGNTTIKKMKTHKKDPGRQNRKRPALPSLDTEFFLQFFKYPRILKTGSY